MAKSIILLIATLVFGNAQIANAIDFLSSTTDYHVSTVDAVYVTSVEAQNHQNTKTRSFRIMRRTNVDGSFRFYAQDSDGVYTISFCNGNIYKPFYVEDENGIRWYFACKELDRATGKTNQW